MSPLGLFITTVGAIGGPGMLGDPGGAAAKPDYFWRHSGCMLEPIPITGTDNNDMWDLDANLDYMPEDASTHAAEGFWAPDTNSDVQPFDCS